MTVRDFSDKALLCSALAQDVIHSLFEHSPSWEDTSHLLRKNLVNVYLFHKDLLEESDIKVLVEDRFDELVRGIIDYSFAPVHEDARTTLPVLTNLKTISRSQLVRDFLMATVFKVVFSSEPFSFDTTATDVVKCTHLVHELNRTYCLLNGDSSQVAFEDAADWQKEAALQGVQDIFDDPNTTPEMTHDNWCRQKFDAGWVLGPVKDADKKTHPCLIPYKDLSKFQKDKDHIFISAVTSWMAFHKK